MLKPWIQCTTASKYYNSLPCRVIRKYIYIGIKINGLARTQYATWQALNRNLRVWFLAWLYKEKETNCSQFAAVKNDTKSIKGNFLLVAHPDWFRSVLALSTTRTRPFFPTHTHKEKKRSGYVRLVGLLLWHKMVYVCCLVWALALQLSKFWNCNIQLPENV